jgi:hypothetical protein
MTNLVYTWSHLRDLQDGFKLVLEEIANTNTPRQPFFFHHFHLLPHIA